MPESLSQRHKQRGLTLLEIIVAIAIFTFIVAIVYEGISQMVRSRAAAVEVADQLSEVQFAVARLQQDLMQFNDRPVRDSYGDRQPALKLEASSLAFTRTGWRNLMGLKRSENQRLLYHLDDQQQLLRSYTLYADAPLQAEVIDQPLLRAVELFEIRILDSKNQWQESWPPLTRDGDSPGVAKAVEFRLEIKGLGEIKRLIELPGGEFVEQT